MVNLMEEIDEHDDIPWRPERVPFDEEGVSPEQPICVLCNLYTTTPKLLFLVFTKLKDFRGTVVFRDTVNSGHRCIAVQGMVDGKKVFDYRPDWYSRNVLPICG